jgi:hypothetical protein
MNFPSTGKAIRSALYPLRRRVFADKSRVKLLWLAATSGCSGPISYNIVTTQNILATRLNRLLMQTNERR